MFKRIRSIIDGANLYILLNFKFILMLSFHYGQRATITSRAPLNYFNLNVLTAASTKT